MSIRLKLTVFILGFIFVPLFVVSAITFSKYQSSLEAAQLTQLQDLAHFKAERIESCFEKWKSGMEMAQGFYNVKKHLPLLIRHAGNLSAPEALAAKAALDVQIPRMMKTLEVTDIMLADTSGKILYTANPSHSAKDISRIFTDIPPEALKASLRGIHFYDLLVKRILEIKFELYVTGPALNLNDTTIGIIIFESDMAPIHALMRDTTGLGRTGEVLIGKQSGNTVLYLNPLRHDSAGSPARQINRQSKIAIPIQNALDRRIGVGTALDYRGQKVIAAWRHIPFLDWGLVAKIDSAEAFADIAQLKRLVLLILGIVFVLVVFITLFMARSFSEPIIRLTRGAEIVGRGDLDYKVATDRKDEIGQLSRTFDKMTRDIKAVTASRNDLNREVAVRIRAEEELKRSNESLEQFAYVASHDLQEPLRAMGSFSQLLEERYKPKLDGDAVEFLGYIVDAAKRMQKLITDLLAYSRIGRSSVPAENADCNTVLGKVLSGLRTQIVESGAVITNDTLPVLFCNESEWTQLFQNLIGNAIKFRGSEPLRIHIGVHKEEGRWLFSVRDNGIGIEDRYQERIFLIFQRLHSRDKYPGTGIGLSICKKIVEFHGGRIWLESAPGKGSTFFFTLPDNPANEETQ